MGELRTVYPVKLFVGLLSAEEEWLDLAFEMCEQEFGTLEKRSPLMPFEYTDYYAEEMGQTLHRQFAIFQPLVEPDCLPDAKLKTNDLEIRLTAQIDCDVSRPVNIDPGYFSASGLFLATTKNYVHRIYLTRGIYGEITLQFIDGTFRPSRWTYPDYKAAESIKFFNEARARYMQQLKREGKK
ncbi:MAG: DUF4416 family protein [Planctomycetota bacterium]|nr:DUF4416 family protein [Planctomycetota bacterium]MDA1139713.1 DUF4416 family protein [Planctomycetota bacterium]